VKKNVKSSSRERGAGGGEEGGTRRPKTQVLYPTVGKRKPGGGERGGGVKGQKAAVMTSRTENIMDHKRPTEKPIQRKQVFRKTTRGRTQCLAPQVVDGKGGGGGVSQLTGAFLGFGGTEWGPF